jgi:hypothetical protein
MEYGLPEQPSSQLTPEERMLLSRWMAKRAGDATSIEPGMITELRAAAERVTEELAAYAARGNLSALTVTVLQAAREVLFRARAVAHVLSRQTFFLGIWRQRSGSA